MKSTGTITENQHGELKGDAKISGHEWHGASRGGRMIQIFGSHDSQGRRVILSRFFEFGLSLLVMNKWFRF